MLAKSQAKRERGDDAVAKPDGNATIALTIGTQNLTSSVQDRNRPNPPCLA